MARTSRTITVLLTADQYDEITTWAVENGHTLSGAVRLLMFDRLEEWKKQTPAEEAWRRGVMREIRMKQKSELAAQFNGMLERIDRGE